MLLILTSLCKSDLKDMMFTLNRVILEDLYIQTYIFVATYIPLTNRVRVRLTEFEFFPVDLRPKREVRGP